MPHHHHPVFVALSLLIAVFGSWTALDLSRRVRSHIGRTRQVWLGTAAVAMGVSIWSMHFIAMLGFDPGVAVGYDVGLTLLSLALAVAATWGAFFSAARERSGGALVMLAGAAMGAGICTMHYVGMAAMRMSAPMRYEPRLVALSLLIAVVAATAALVAARRERSRRWRATAALILGFAIAGMHYTGMAALILAPGHAAGIGSGAPPYGLGLGVAAGAMLILFLALLAALYDQRLNVLAALEAGGVGYWELSLPDRTLHVSPRGRRLLDRRPGTPFGVADLLAMAPSGDGVREAQLQAAIDTDKEYDLELRIVARRGGTRWVNVRGRVVDRVAGRPRRMVGVMFDITERQEAFAQVADSERRQRLLIDELNHRVKNTLAAVQSISRQSAKRAGSIDDFRELFEARLIALSQTHNALTRTSWERAQLDELLHQQLDPYPPDQVQLDGPQVDLAPREALALGMVFHELAMNAAKYGALSTRAGRVRVSWAVIPGGAGEELLLDWAESGGPAVTAPGQRGFGTRMVQGAVMGELGGTSELSFETGGFRCKLSIPLDFGRGAARDEPNLKSGVQEGFSATRAK
ncbi:MAG: PAS domain S-box protein [Phenylobacterium sp.]|uniref:MHYT domain-containing protein n=1 Tax=Phenylobacterium sp. TaxID=1871053 RepID=UPI0011FBE4F7|nr:MHYT domain-containing protein [Phenylobacterium sp.]TAJ72142.1 MAG: PAS domain S-box protein [Phenylobacterium sp.]